VSFLSSSSSTRRCLVILREGFELISFVWTFLLMRLNSKKLTDAELVVKIFFLAHKNKGRELTAAARPLRVNL